MTIIFSLFHIKGTIQLKSTKQSQYANFNKYDCNFRETECNYRNVTTTFKPLSERLFN